MVGKKERQPMIDRQLELGFNGVTEVRPATRNQRRPSRARWWFDRMHQVVSSARECTPAPPARPEQRCLVFPEPNHS
jgi:hypothetical protein